MINDNRDNPIEIFILATKLTNGEQHARNRTRLGCRN